MRAVTTILLLTGCIAFNETRAQFASKCDMTILETIEHGGKHSEPVILNYLITNGAECRTNVEFYEWSNELLFSLLYKQTQITLTTLEKNQNDIEVAEIIEMLGNPVVDTFDLQYIESAVLKASVDRKLKKQILQRLDLAIKKQN